MGLPSITVELQPQIAGDLIVRFDPHVRFEPFEGRVGPDDSLIAASELPQQPDPVHGDLTQGDRSLAIGGRRSHFLGVEQRASSAWRISPRLADNRVLSSG